MSGSSIDRHPYLLSIGFGMPLFGVWGHRYIRVKKRYPLRSKRILGVHIVWTSYRRLSEEDSQTSYDGAMASHDSTKKPGSL